MCQSTMAQDDDDKVDNMNPTEAAVARDPPAAEHTVAWADGSPHEKSLPEGNCCSRGSAGTVSELPLKPKFAEEGSTAAAVGCENSMSATRVNTTGTAETPATTLSPLSIVTTSTCINNTGSSTLQPQVREREPACDMFEQSQQQGGIGSSAAHIEDEQHEDQVATAMGSKVEDSGSLNDVSIDQMGAEDAAQASVPFKGESASAPTTTGCVLLPPSLRLRVDSADEVFVLRSMSEDAGDADVAAMLTLSMGTSNDGDDGIILPPSYSNISFNSSNKNSPSNNSSNNTSNPGAISQVLSLPIDSLHCVASFLTPLEWAQYGQTCSAASKICREIFRRVRIHGFRCATEVVMAWVSALHLFNL
jgi:hypothetical protein